MDISSRKISLPLLLVLLEIAKLLTSSCYYSNYVFALQQQNPLLQKNDNINDNITKKFTLIADENIVRLSPNNNFFHPSGILYKAMTFNYTIPGPVIAVDQGDTFQITLQNKGKLVHSLDLHGIEGSSQALSGIVKPGESKTWKVKAVNAGVFMYHCDGDNLNGIWDHIASGMYGGIVVHSKDERRPAKEFYIVFGEVYNTADKGFFMGATNTNTTTYATTTTIANSKNEEKSAIQKEEEQIGSFDMNKFIANKPDLILTNGMAYKYIPFFGSETKIILNKDAELFKVKPGELTRWYIVNAGPRGYLAFNFASGMINSVVYDDSNSSNKSNTIDRNNDNVITHSPIENNNIASSSSSSKKIYEVSIPPGSAETIEATFPEGGTYVGNDHDIGRFLIGAGFVVVATNNSSTSNDYPKGTWVPPYGYGAGNINNIRK